MSKTNMRAPLARQACELCRQRKVRCDAGRPNCGGCILLKKPCHYSAQHRKRGPKPRHSSVASSGHGASSSREDDHLSPASGMPAESCFLSSPVSFPDTQSYVQATSPAIGSPQIDTRSPGATLGFEPRNRAQQVHDDLSAALKALPQSLEDIVNGCVEKIVLSFFSTMPVLHPPTIRQNTRLLQESARGLFDAVSSSETSPPIPYPSGDIMRTFAQLTAIFAAVSCRPRPKTQVDHTEALSLAFLTASRGMMACCEDWDIAYPDSSSLITRICQSTAFHHLGKTRASWLVMGQAFRLAIDMRLYDEASYQGLDTLEATLRRNIFRALCTTEMSASVLNNKPLSFHEILWDDFETASKDTENEFCLLASEESLFEPPYEKNLNEGFHLIHRLWKTATNILYDMRMMSHANGGIFADQSLSDHGRQRIMSMYMTFCGLLDLLPPWLRDPASYVTTCEAATTFQRRTFWNQRVDIIVTFHCLRLNLLQSASQKGLCALLGLTSNLDMLALRRIEITHDLTSFVTSAPFEALQSNGEPLVEKLRQVGVSLLEITHQNENETISGRARALLSTILDVIARLDSRVSDELVRAQQ